jgi:abortive infection bacteriophage resistance protein
MSKVPYAKQIQTFASQIAILKQRGMAFADEAAAEAWLRRVSYYRMSGYWYPLLADRLNHVFKLGTTFEQAVSLYEFDSRLRRLVFTSIGRIEVAVRTQMAYVMSMAKGGTWFADASLFTNVQQHAKTLQSIGDEYQRSDEQFVRAFKRKYSDPLPPSWMTLEITSFGTMSIIYQYLKPGVPKRDVAAVFGVSDTVFASWLHTLVYVRNVCAHHTRLWNRTLGVRPLMPRRPRGTFIAQPASGTQRVYFVLAIIRYWLNIIDRQNTLTQDLQQLFADFPSVHASALGFPRGWNQEPLWQ